MVLAFRDISDALRMQEERAKASKLASLGLLAGGIAHDFNNILMAVMGNVSMARAAMPSGPAMRALAEAEQACVRARQLTWQLLTFSKGGAPVKKTIAIPRILKESAGLALRGSSVELHARHRAGSLAGAGRRRAARAGVQQRADQRPAGDAARRRDRDSRREHRRAEQRWEYALRVEPGRTSGVSISDKGIGIPEEHLGRIFDPYFTHQADGQRPRARHLVLDHQEPRRLLLGGLEARARDDACSVNLPASTSSELKVEPPAPVAPRTGAGTGRMLVMDDEASIRTLAANMLTFLGYDADVVDSGSAAVERYQRALKSGQPFDAVILDLIVPGGMGGREAMEQLGEVDPAVNAILVSGYAQDPAMTEFRDYGFKGVISKPFTLEELQYDLALRHGHTQLPGALTRRSRECCLRVVNR